MTDGLQLYAEPSLILYIRTKFDLSNVVIVSPDAGGAKRCVTMLLCGGKESYTFLVGLLQWPTG
jgi:hypothetical protein